jgi:drug/metabolite transporter (DMT)-like permease
VPDPRPNASAPRWRTAALTVAALVCFAANSLLCRSALGPRLIDPATFTIVRLAAGALVLGLVQLSARRRRPAGGTAGSAAALFVYAAAFSFAYVRIGAGVGSLLLFAAVQVTMVGASAWRGARPRLIETVGVVVALLGLGWLVLPGASAPDETGAVLMIAAGVAWGLYTLRGRKAGDPLSTTAANFLISVPLALLLAAVALGASASTGRGLWLAAASGALASGGGYSLWYAVVPALGATRAAAVQLSVPVLTGLGASAFLGEHLTVRIGVAATAILAGIALALTGRPATSSRPPAGRLGEG